MIDEMGMKWVWSTNHSSAEFPPGMTVLHYASCAGSIALVQENLEKTEPQTLTPMQPEYIYMKGRNIFGI